jgi:GT2 family glycosyltransferase
MIESVIVAVKDFDIKLSQRLWDEYWGQYDPDKVIQVPNSEAEGICAKYNLGIDQIDTKKEDSWVIFCHDDVFLKSSPHHLWDVLKRMDDKGADIVCAAGNVSIPKIDPGYWWEGLTTADFRGSGAVLHRTPGTEDMFHIESYGPFPQQVAVFDGLWFAVKASAFKNPTLRFEGSFPGYHFYDVDFCATARSLDLKIWTVDVMVLHNKWGKGIEDPSFKEHQQLFIDKWSKKKHLYYKGSVAASNNSFVKKTSAF